MPSRIELFLAHLDHLTGGLEPSFLPLPSTHPELKGVTVITYQDLPEPGMLTAITYGLSLASHPHWQHGRPELCISVHSTDNLWGLAVGHLAETLRGDCPFAYGDIINFGEPMSPESAMTSFVVFAPAVLDRDDFLGIHLGDDDHVNIAGMYPLHATEATYIKTHGLKSFWDLDWDPYDVRRAPAC